MARRPGRPQRLVEREHTCRVVGGRLLVTVEDPVEEVGRAGQVLRAVGERGGQVGRELVRRQPGPLLDEAATQGP